MKKITSVSLILISCLTIMVFIISKSNEEKNIIQGKSLDNLSTTETLVFEAKTDGFESLDELESNSKIILRGKKIGEESPVIYRSEVDGSVAGGYTVTNFKISKVYKNETKNKKIKEKEEVNIAENNFFDKKTNKTYSFNGYKKMNVNEEYLLFLTPEQDGVFATRGVTFGKIPLETNKIEVLKDTEEPLSLNLQKIFSEARNQYK